MNPKCKYQKYIPHPTCRRCDDIEICTHEQGVQFEKKNTYGTLVQIDTSLCRAKHCEYYKDVNDE